MEIITTHKNTDFDALASVFAAKILYPQAAAVLPASLNANTRAFLSLHKDVFAFMSPADVDQSGVGRLVVVDTNRWERLDGLAPLRERRELDIHLWDHHEEPGDIAASWACQEQVGSTIALLVRRLEAAREDLTPIQATLFLAGLYEDTGNLTFPATTAQDARAAAFLLGHRADLGVVGGFLRPLYGPKQKDVLFEMLKDVKRMNVNGYRISLNTVEIKGHTPRLALVVDMLQDIVNVDAAFGIFVEPGRDRCMVIGRSSVESLDVGAIMRSMGGGGHPSAGSALLKSVNPEAVEGWILELMQGNQQSSVQIGDLMSFPVVTVSPGTTMKEVAQILRSRGCTGIPVVEGDRVVGIISRRDFRGAKREPALDAPVKAYMSGRVIFIAPQESVNKAARLMIKNDVGRLPVVEDGRLIGIITRSDVMRYSYDLLPGEIPRRGRGAAGS